MVSNLGAKEFSRYDQLLDYYVTEYGDKLTSMGLEHRM